VLEICSTCLNACQMNKGTPIAALGDLKTYGFCLACGKSEDLDLESLIAQHGSGRSYVKGALAVRCSYGARPTNTFTRRCPSYDSAGGRPGSADNKISTQTPL